MSIAEQIYSRFCCRASKDDEYNDWANYRKELTDFIIRSVSPGSSLLILGAGKCNDLDLGRLAAHCGTITLSDYRPETAEEAFHRYGLAPSEKLRFAEADYVGIPDRDYIAYTDLLFQLMQKLAGASGNSLEEAAGEQLGNLRQGLEQIYESNASYRIDLGCPVHDNAAACGVHSQLNNSFRGIFQYVRKEVEDRGAQVPFAEELNREIYRITGSHTEDLVRRFNDAVFAAAGEGVVYGYERSMIYTPRGEISPVIGTVDGARQAGEAVADLTAADSMRSLWPLSRRRNIRFDMDIAYYRIKDKEEKR